VRVYQFRHIRADAQSSHAPDSLYSRREGGLGPPQPTTNVLEVPNRVVAEGRLDSVKAIRFPA
jgi:hypothetical protein